MKKEFKKEFRAARECGRLMYFTPASWISPLTSAQRAAEVALIWRNRGETMPDTEIRRKRVARKAQMELRESLRGFYLD